MKEGTLAFWPKISVKRYTDLITCFGSENNALNAAIADGKKIPWNASVIDDFFTWRASASQTVPEIKEQLAKENISVITDGDPQYPPLLKVMEDRPYVLFVRGQLQNLTPSLAVVGSRKASEYGLNVIKKLIPEVVDAGVSIISGLATGIDSAAHQAALKAGGHTVAVLGFGIGQADLGHARSKHALAESIVESGGALVSEYLPGTPGNTFTFPLRNRIIAGLSKATLIIEARAGSGSLITADCSQQVGREIMVVPQPIFSLSGIGANDKIKEGAHPVTSAQDILEILKISQPKKSTVTTPEYNPLETAILALLLVCPQDRDQLARELALNPVTLGAVLTNLELNGAIYLKNNHYYCSN